MAYNGWTNWETWNVALWIDNEEGSYREKIRYFNRHECDGDNVEKFVGQIYPDGTPDMDSPKEMNGVNWDEIAENWKSELGE